MRNVPRFFCGPILALFCLAFAGCVRPRTPNPTPPESPVRIDHVCTNAWGLGALSVCSGRETPEHKAELGTQVLMGEAVQVLRRANRWCQVRTSDGYLCWLENGTFRLCTETDIRAWTNSQLVVVTALEEVLRSQPNESSEPVSDLVVANLLQRLGQNGAWTHVETPDGRQGWVPTAAVEDYGSWRDARRPTRENIERTARRFLGRPYLWGGNSPKGLDCSGLTKLVFYVNGIDLPRNASQQARCGIEIALDPELSQLRTGDLLFFGRRAGQGRPERVTHVGIYLGGKLMVHSSGLVQVNSLEPGSPISDDARIQRLLFARRLPFE